MGNDPLNLLKRFTIPIWEILKPRGFKKKGFKFVADSGDVLLIVQLQSSTSSTSSQKVLTANLGVFSKTLSGKMGYQISEPTVWDGHWQERLGWLMKDPSDKWWTVSAEDEAQAAGLEVAGLLKEVGIPLIESLNSTERLRELWQSGKFPGITQTQRDDYLAYLAK